MERGEARADQGSQCRMERMGVAWRFRTRQVPRSML